MGDPGGIGAEILVKALADPAVRALARWRVHGLDSCLLAAAKRAGIAPFWARSGAHEKESDAPGAREVVVIDHGAPAGARAAPFGEPWPAQSTALGGEFSFQCVEHAIADARRDAADPQRADAIVTAPISKHSWALAGHAEFPGHTELLAARFDAPRVGMFFHAPVRAGTPAFNVILATVHVPLMDVRRVLSTRRVLDAIELGERACREIGDERPRIGVAGLNPHAGEAGLLGDEEARIIEPAVREAARAGIDCRGPFPGDTIFNALIAGDLDLVVAMYHDQGLIPVKLLARERAVNVTVGLPTVRTSPDHGTAFDIAGKNLADPGSMKSALMLAARIAERRRAASV